MALPLKSLLSFHESSTVLCRLIVAIQWALSDESIGCTCRASAQGEWSIRVNGKDRKIATTDLLPAAKDALNTYLHARLHSAVLENNEQSLPVLAKLDDKTEAADRKVAWRVLRRFRKLAAQELVSVDMRLAAQIERLSPHTLRHILGQTRMPAGRK